MLTRNKKKRASERRPKAKNSLNWVRDNGRAKHFLQEKENFTRGVSRDLKLLMPVPRLDRGEKALFTEKAIHLNKQILPLYREHQ